MSQPMPVTKTRPLPLRWLLGLSIATVAAATAIVSWMCLRPPSAGPSNTFPLPPYPDSRYLNTRPEAHYVGTEVCASCHEDKHTSYLLTTHSQALSDADPAKEPPDGSFYHARSGRTYRVYRQGGQLRHEEVVRSLEGQEMARTDLPVRYLIGSGHFSRSYFVEVDGFLQESPITWYTSKKQWGISPGYDVPNHQGFERPITDACLSCHAGRFDSGGTMSRTTLLEKAIGCENCHGPGSLHAAARQAGRGELGVEDLSIVNPKRLPRALREDVCAACHLSGAARVSVRGRQVSDFRPGLPLADFRLDYKFSTGNEAMTVVGHVEQLRNSKCYQGSKELTCVTCHDPHAAEKPKDPVAFYRQKCLDCHATKPCGLDETQRRNQQPGDNCAACHMKRGDTDIPHIAFTHHRIGLHNGKPAAPPKDAPELVPTADVSQWPEYERQRNLGLAYLDASGNSVYAGYAPTFVERARVLLEQVHTAGLHDAETATALAEIYQKNDPVRSERYAREANAVPNASAEVRAFALMRLAAGDARDQHYDTAVGLLQQLVTLRRNSDDWGTLGACYAAQDRLDDALAALQQALAIRPTSPVVHATLAEVYRKKGDTAHAQEHDAKARWLVQHHQD